MSMNVQVIRLGGLPPVKRPARLSPAITCSDVGKKLVRLMAEGLLGYCDQQRLPYPKTYQDFEETVVQISRITGFQAGLGFAHKPSHRKFYELLGMNPDYAGRPYSELFQIAESDPAVSRGLKLVSAFATPARPEDRAAAQIRSAKIFREDGGSEFELIAQAFEVGDCQRDLVFDEMQEILKERRV